MDGAAGPRTLTHLRSASAPVRPVSPLRDELSLHPDLLERLIRDAPVGVAFLDTEFRYRLINPALAELNDVPLEDHLGRRVSEVLPHLWPHLEPLYRRVLETTRPVTEVAITGRVGSASEDRHWLANYHPVPDEDGRPIGIGVVIVETTARVRAEQEVRRLAAREGEARADIQLREESLRALVAAIPDLIFELDGAGRHLGHHNPSAASLWAPPDEFLGRTVREVLPGPVADAYEAAIPRALETGQTQVFEYRLDYRDEGLRTFDARMVKKTDDQVLVIVRDVTDVRALEAKFRHAQKMEAMGRLAGGIAHDFNNLLTVINGNSDLLLNGGPHADGDDLVREIREAGSRAAALTQQLLLFTRQQLVEPRVLDLNEVVARAERMLHRLLGEDVLLSTHLDPALPPVKADAGQIEQVLVNLSVNARDAMPDGGRLYVETRAVDGAGGQEVVLEIRDTGLGMEAGVRERIFEPFFTTKPPGRGSGLGLSVVFGVLEQCGASVEVDSEPGAGTTFLVRFPAAEGPVLPVGRSAPDELPTGTETILLVEDDDAVRAVVERVLRSCDYEVLVARNGREALERSEGWPHPIDLLASDVVMPSMGGRELAERLLVDRPDTRVLFLSGYTDDEMLRQGVRHSDVAFLQKPFTPAELAKSVRAVLDRPLQTGP